MKTTINPGSPIETLTRDELRGELDRSTQEWFRQYARGVKYMRFGPIAVVPDSAAGGLVDTDGSPENPGPNSGFIWTVKRMAIQGLASGDSLSIYRGNTFGVPLWVLTDTNPIATFGKMEIVLMPGENLILSGTLSGDQTVYFAGDVLECAAEEIIKLV